LRFDVRTLSLWSRAPGARPSAAAWMPMVAKSNRSMGAAFAQDLHAVGMDTDIAVWELKLNRIVHNSALHHAVDHTPYEGMSLTGWPVTSRGRGQVAMESGTRRVEPGFGKSQPRGSIR
jgi:dihydroorotase-like cyclic amidohydrolase